jgi:hypothetical protein
MAASPPRSFLARLLGRLKGTPRQPSSATAPPLRPFQAIAIYRGVNCCAVARKFSEHRFLAKDAPGLPLLGCSMPERCECRYLKYKDRRGDARRLVDFGLAARLFDGKERRARNGRRSTD